MPRIESLLAARLFVAPQLANGRMYFISNLSGRLSLYVMDEGGSVPEPLLPPHIALQNPELIGGYPFYVFPALGQILVMIDADGDENYQPMRIPIDGGFPEPAFGDRFRDDRVRLLDADPIAQVIYLNAESRSMQQQRAYQVDLGSGRITELGASAWGAWIDGVNKDHSKAIIVDGYTAGDTVLFLWTREQGKRRLLYGKPLEDRAPEETVSPNAIFNCAFTPGDRGLLCVSAIYEDCYGLTYFDLHQPDQARPVAVEGTRHNGVGEMVGLKQLHEDRYLVSYNIDGISWAYEGTFDETALRMRFDTVICGEGRLSNGVIEAINYDQTSDRYALSFATATSPTQIFTIERDRRARQHTRERVLGIPEAQLSPGEDASFNSFDGLRISARLYLPSPELGFTGARPLVYYIHGGPQSQERPNFAWFSMPLIQFLTLRGFAVFVPNARGSTGYGLSYMKQVDRDWGGQDRLDHVHAMQLLQQDTRVDTTRAGVVGRSYGGYMTLTLAARHPTLWKAAVDMFGPYDLFSFMDRIPEAWKPYFAIAVGDPVKDRDLLIERSPRTYMDQLACPLLVIQGKNDPRVVERESRNVVEQLQAKGKQVAYLMFENEGHDVLKFENRVRCYNAIADFFAEHLQP